MKKNFFFPKTFFSGLRRLKRSWTASVFYFVQYFEVRL